MYREERAPKSCAQATKPIAAKHEEQKSRISLAKTDDSQDPLTRGYWSAPASVPEPCANDPWKSVPKNMCRRSEMDANVVQPSDREL